MYTMLKMGMQSFFYKKIQDYIPIFSKIMSINTLKINKKGIHSHFFVKK